MKWGYLALIGAVLAVVLLSGCTGSVGSTGYDKEVNCPQITLDQGLEIEKNDFDDSGNLYIIHSPFEHITIPSEWKVDSEKTIGTTALSCKKGYKEGQNADYWYCSPIFLEKLITNENGEILSKEKLSIASVFKKESGIVKEVSFTCYAPED